MTARRRSSRLVRQTASPSSTPRRKRSRNICSSASASGNWRSPLTANTFTQRTEFRMTSRSSKWPASRCLSQSRSVRFPGAWRSRANEFFHAGPGSHEQSRRVPPAALEVAGASYSYGKRKALENVGFSVAQGSFSVLLGLNGAGKSTLFCLITRLFATQRGTVRIFGFDVNRAPCEALRRLGVVFQARTLDLDLTVMQNLSYHAALHGISGQETKLRAGFVLDRVKMADRARDKVRDLSGGQMRRVEIARALLHRPRMLLLDEPTVGLDINARTDILKHVRGLVAREGIGVLWATHLIDEIEPGDDVVVLHEGKILDHGNASEIAARAGAAGIGPAFNVLTSAAGYEAEPK